MSRPAILFRYDSRDAYPALCGLGNVALLFGVFLGFRDLPWWLLAPAWLAIAFCYWWNLQCISHNFIHNPFFTSRWLNRVYSVLESLAIGVPQILYHHYHMNHHWGDSDARAPDGTTRDWSSIYRYSMDDRPEPFVRYCFLSFFRVEIRPVLAVVFRHGPGQVIQMAAECLALGAFWGFMLWWNWQYFVFYYLTSYYFGWVLSYAEGYLEHYRCQPGNPLANSVSSYHRLYNLLCFNNGFHQEHHWEPKKHWTQMPALHEELAPQLVANGTRVLRGPHLTSFLEDWWNESEAGRRQVAGC
jgi:fatty acid desaturase